MKLALFAGVCVASLCVTAADAATSYNFIVAPILNAGGTPLQVDGFTDGRTFTFTIGASETPTTGLPFAYPNYRVHSYSYTEFGSTTPVVVPATLGKNIVFFDTMNQGGLSLTNSGNRNFFVYNTLLFDEVAYKAAIQTNPAAQPVFNLGTFAVSTAPRNNAATRPIDNYTVTISDAAAAAVPEPASWAMMVAGFGLLGGTMRRRRPSSAIARTLKIEA